MGGDAVCVVFVFICGQPGLRWANRQLQDRRILTRTQPCKEHDATVGKLDGIVMGARIISIDLAEAADLIWNRPFPSSKKQRLNCAMVALDVLFKDELRSRQEANCDRRFFRRGKPASELFGKFEVISLSPTWAGREDTL